MLRKANPLAHVPESSKLDISAATVRNVMSELEGMGMVKVLTLPLGEFRLQKVIGFR